MEVSIKAHSNWERRQIPTLISVGSPRQHFRVSRLESVIAQEYKPTRSPIFSVFIGEHTINGCSHALSRKASSVLKGDFAHVIVTFDTERVRRRMGH